MINICYELGCNYCKNATCTAHTDVSHCPITVISGVNVHKDETYLEISYQAYDQNRRYAIIALLANFAIEPMLKKNKVTLTA